MFNILHSNFPEYRFVFKAFFTWPCWWGLVVVFVAVFLNAAILDVGRSAPFLEWHLAFFKKKKTIHTPLKRFL